MDTLQLFKINDNQLLASLNASQPNFSKSIKIDVKFKSLQEPINQIKHDILNGYIKSGGNKQTLEFLKEQSYTLFNILNLFDFQNYFSKLKTDKKPSHIQIILDSDTNSIPFEILHDGKDFLSDYIIFSRMLIDFKNKFGDSSLIESNNKFTLIGNPSESEDISHHVDNELNEISSLIAPFFQLKGPYKKRYVDKIELIRLLGTSSLFHFSGHYHEEDGMGGCKLF